MNEDSTDEDRMKIWKNGNVLCMEIGLLSSLDAIYYEDLIGYTLRTIQLRLNGRGRIILEGHRNGLDPAVDLVSLIDPMIVLEESPWTLQVYKWECKPWKFSSVYDAALRRHAYPLELTFCGPLSDVVMECDGL